MRCLPPVLLAVSLGLICATPLGRAQEQPSITGGLLAYDDRSREAVYTVQPRLVLGDTVLTADEIRYNRATGLARATGHFNLTTGARRLLADAGTYNYRTRELSVTNLRLGEYPVYISGDTLVGAADRFTFTNATVFFREADEFAPTLRARRLTWERGRFLAGEDVRLGLFKFGLPPLHLRTFHHDLGTSLLSHLRATAGYRRHLGAIIEAGLHLPVVPGFEAGADAGFFSARGLMLGPFARYGGTAPDNTYAGFLRSGFINDHGEKLTDVLGRPVPEERGFLEWRHQQRLGERLTLAGQFSYWRDSEVVRDFRPKDFVNVQQPDSFVEGAYAGDHYVVSAFTRVQPNRYHRIQQRLPEVRLDVLPTVVGAGVWARLNASFAGLHEGAFGPTPVRRTDRYDAYFALERPFAPTEWFVATPVAGVRGTAYTDPINRGATYYRTVGELGFDARLRAAGTFAYKNDLWGIDGLRHLVEPRLSYRYAPEADHGRRYIPAIDRPVFSTYLQPLSLGDQRNVDALAALDTLRLGLGNILQTRASAHGSRDLLSLDLAADYQFCPAPADRRWSAVHTGFALTPAPWLRLDVYHRVTPQDCTLREWNTGLELIDQQWWSLRLTTHYLQHQFEDYFIDGRRRLNEVYDGLVRLRIDARHHRVTEQTYGLWQKLGRTWAVKYEVSFSEGPRREGHFGVNVEIDFLRF
jgi:LPS-assembly protein